MTGRRAAMLAAAVAAVLGGLAAAAGEGASRPRVTAMVLGVAQDGGVPHLGCTKSCCEAARKDPRRAHRVASIALVHESSGSPRRVFIVDATPDYRSQIDSALGDAARGARAAGEPIDGVLLTHAHIGHYTGLMYHGKESMASRRVPVWATDRMASFLRANGPWKRLVQDGAIDLRRLVAGRTVVLAPGLSVEPLRVAHREEESDAVGFIVSGPGRRLLYIPDIDAWDRWDRNILDVARSTDVALIDGTFFAPADLGGRSAASIPHPYITDSMERLEPLLAEGRRIVFTHLNHSNPVLQADAPERLEVERRGFEIAVDGMTMEL